MKRVKILGLICKDYEKMEKSEKFGFMWKSCEKCGNMEIWGFIAKNCKKNCEKLEGIVVKVMKISEREAFGGKWHKRD